MTKYILVYVMELCAWRKYQIFNTSESKWIVSTFVDYFIAMT